MKILYFIIFQQGLLIELVKRRLLNSMKKQ